MSRALQKLHATVVFFVFLGAVILRPAFGKVPPDKAFEDFVHRACLTGKELDIVAEADGTVSVFTRGVKGGLHFNKAEQQGVTKNLTGRDLVDDRQNSRDCEWRYHQSFAQISQNAIEKASNNERADAHGQNDSGTKKVRTNSLPKIGGKQHGHLASMAPYKLLGQVLIQEVVLQPLPGSREPYLSVIVKNIDDSSSISKLHFRLVIGSAVIDVPQESPMHRRGISLLPSDKMQVPLLSLSHFRAVLMRDVGEFEGVEKVHLIGAAMKEFKEQCADSPSGVPRFSRCADDDIPIMLLYSYVDDNSARRVKGIEPIFARINECGSVSQNSASTCSNR